MSDKLPFIAYGLVDPVCVCCNTLTLSEKAEKLRKLLAARFVGSCVGAVVRSFSFGVLVVYVCARHAQQLEVRTK